MLKMHVQAVRGDPDREIPLLPRVIFPSVGSISAPGTHSMRIRHEAMRYPVERRSTAPIGEEYGNS
jgi:hypothetical protein